MSKSLYFRIAGIVCLLVGAWVAFSGWQTVRLAYASEDWPTTDGLLLHSAIVRVRGSDDSFDEYRHDVYYSYSVDGRTYHSSRLRFGSAYSAFPELETKIPVYETPMGRKVEVLPGTTMTIPHGVEPPGPLSPSSGRSPKDTR